MDSINSFAELPLKPELLRAVTDMGFTAPSPIQAQALPILLEEDGDFIGLAATGTGKTAAFTLPLLQRLDPDKREVQAIILCPTRELSMQVAGQVNLLGKHLGIKACAIYGGAGYDQQLRELKRGVPVVVGTPGRIMDHMERKTLKLDSVRIAVLDEADEMISMGFREAMEMILGAIPREHSQTWLFSATMSSPVRKVASQFLRSPRSVQVNRSEMLSSTIEQTYYMTHEGNKPEVLCKLIDNADDFYGIVFCQTKSLVSDLTRYLGERGYKVDCLHGDMSQTAREQTMQAFRDRRIKILVCTDVAARGLDVKDITHVINYSIPRELDSYVHRIGRTARSGKTGKAMSLVTNSHRHLISKIEYMTKSKLTEGVVPSRKVIGMKKIGQLHETFTGPVNHARALELMDENWKASVAGMSAEEVASRFLAVMFPWVFAEEKQKQMHRTDRAPQSGDARDSRDDRRGGERRYGRQDRGPRDGRDYRAPRDRGDRANHAHKKFDSRAPAEAAPAAPRIHHSVDSFVRAEAAERVEHRDPRNAHGDYPPRRRANDSKDERRQAKREEKRDFKKRFKKPFAHGGPKRRYDVPPRTPRD